MHTTWEAESAFFSREESQVTEEKLPTRVGGKSRRCHQPSSSWFTHWKAKSITLGVWKRRKLQQLGCLAGGPVQASRRLTSERQEHQEMDTAVGLEQMYPRRHSYWETYAALVLEGWQHSDAWCRVHRLYEGQGPQKCPPCSPSACWAPPGRQKTTTCSEKHNLSTGHLLTLAEDLGWAGEMYAFPQHHDNVLKTQTQETGSKWSSVEGRTVRRAHALYCRRSLAAPERAQDYDGVTVIVRSSSDRKESTRRSLSKQG